MNKKKILSVTDQMNLFCFYSGIAWLIGGIVLFFDGIIFTIIEILAMLAICITHIVVMKAKKEKQDELSIKNYHIARSHALSIMHVIYMVILIALQIITTIPANATLSLEIKDMLIPAFFISLGIEYIIVGFLFRKYERDGEECIY